MQAEVSEMQKISEDQDALFNEQEEMMQNIWNDDFGVVPTPTVSAKVSKQSKTTKPATVKKVAMVSTTTPAVTITPQATQTPSVATPTVQGNKSFVSKVFDFLRSLF